jgi:hypothetical protein
VTKTATETRVPTNTTQPTNTPNYAATDACATIEAGGGTCP